MGTDNIDSCLYKMNTQTIVEYSTGFQKGACSAVTRSGKWAPYLRRGNCFSSPRVFNGLPSHLLTRKRNRFVFLISKQDLSQKVHLDDSIHARLWPRMMLIQIWGLQQIEDVLIFVCFFRLHYYFQISFVYLYALFLFRVHGQNIIIKNGHTLKFSHADKIHV